MRFSPKKKWHEPAAIWPIVLAESGDGKSPAAKLPMGILQRIQAANFHEHDALMAAHHQWMMEHKAAEAAWLKKGAKDGAPPPQKPEEPNCARLMTSDVTMERLAELLHENERGLLLFRDELSGFLKSFDAYKSGKGGDLAHWLSIWSGENIVVDRKTLGKRPIYVRSAYCCVHGGCQPAIWARLLRNGEFVEAGLIARFLVAMPPRRSQKWSDDEVDDRVMGAMTQVVDNLLTIPLDRDDDQEPKPRILPLELDAKQHFVAWHDELVAEQEELAGHLSAVCSKLKGGAIRLAGIIQLTRWACGEGGASDNVVDLQSIKAGCMLASWFFREAQRIDAVLRETPEQRKQRGLVEKIEQLGGRATVRKLCRSIHRFMGNAELAETELLALERANFGTFQVMEPGSVGGQPLREFVLISTEQIDTTPETDGQDEVVSASTPSNEPKTMSTAGSVISEKGGEPWIDMEL